MEACTHLKGLVVCLGLAKIQLTILELRVLARRIHGTSWYNENVKGEPFRNHLRLKRANQTILLYVSLQSSEMHQVGSLGAGAQLNRRLRLCKSVRN
jgi:hypothetical protein